MDVNTFITADSLLLNLHKEGLRIIDCRFNLANPAWGKCNYLESHIPSAIYADLEKDLSGPITPQSGRHPLPDPETFAVKISKWGIDAGNEVIVYDTDNGSIGARLWWLLRAYGYTHVSILSGGFGKWISEGLPTETGNKSLKPPNPPFTRPDPNLFISTSEMELLLYNTAYLLIDARSAERYSGEQEPIDPIAGHIPGSINRFHGLNLNSDGTIKSKDQLKTEYLLLMGNIPPNQVVVYCGSGVTSCLHLAAMEHAGLFGARLYPGSWSEWIRDPRRPIIRKDV
jgi:thiosulfate/3-mercaptopyruvate sulfurtransferase